MPEPPAKSFEFEEFSFETGGNLLLRAGSIIPLEPVASRVLRYFLENEGRLLTKEEILEAVWPDVFTTEDVLKRAVSHIRRALGEDARNGRFLETHHRRGYRFVRQAAAVDAAPETLPPPVTPDEPRPFENSLAGALFPNFDCFVGRSRELDLLKAEFRRSESGVGQPVIVVGEPGIGKTLTANTVAAWAASRGALALNVRFFDYEASFIPPIELFLDLLAEACREILGVAPELLRTAVESELGVRLPKHLFEERADPQQPADDLRRAAGPIADAFVALSRRRPLLLVLDDLQWADRTSQSIIGHLMKVSGPAPLMILGLTRRGELEDRDSSISRWLQEQSEFRTFTTLELAPLDPDECRALIGEVFRGRIDVEAIPAADVERIHSATGGNPYFIVETLRLLVVERHIARAGAGWDWRSIGDVPLPETVRMAARAKLARLSDATREMVECASVLGDTFQLRTLGIMIAESTAPDEAAFDSALDEVIAARVFSEQNVGGADDCQFYHTTLRRAVYMDLSPRRRKRLHTRAIRAIEASHAGHLERFTAALASHAESAGDFERSLELNLRACQTATARFDWAEAAELIGRAERVAENGRLPESFQLLARRGEVYMSVGRRAEAEQILERAAALADDAGVLHNLGKTRILLGKYKAAVAPLERSYELARAADDGFAASAARIQLASATYALCQYEESCAILQEIVDREGPDSYNRAVALGKIGWTRALQSRYREAKALLEEAFAFHRGAGDLRERAVLAMCLSWCEHGLGSYESAIRFAELARSEAMTVHEAYNESVAMMRIAKARTAQGFAAEALEMLGEIASRQEKLGAQHAFAETIWARGKALTMLGKFDDAERELERALGMIVEIGDRDDEFRILVDQASAAIARGRLDEAVELCDRAAAICEEIGVEEGVGETLVVRCEAQAKAGDSVGAVASGRRAVEILGKFESGGLWRACSSLADALASDADAEGRDSEVISLLTRAVELLDATRRQFDPSEERRFAEFSLLNNGPATRLAAALRRAGRDEEAQEIEHSWGT